MSCFLEWSEDSKDPSLPCKNLKKGKIHLKKKVSSSTSLRIQFSHAEPSGTSKSNITIVSFPKTHSIQASLETSDKQHRGHESSKATFLRKTHCWKVSTDNFLEEPHTTNSFHLCSQMQKLFTANTASSSDSWTLNYGNGIHWLKFNLISILFNFFKYVIFFPPHDTAFDPNKCAVTEAFRAFVLCSLCKISLRGSTTCSHWPHANWGESPKASWCHCTDKSLTNKWEKNIMNIQTSSVKLIVLMKPSQINSKLYSHHILILIL